MSDGELIYSIFKRPRMFCDDIATFRDVVMFAEGVCHGLRPPHGSGTLSGFSEYLAVRYGQSNRSWPQILLAQFGDLSWQQACGATCELLRAWQVEEAI